MACIISASLAVTFAAGKQGWVHQQVRLLMGEATRQRLRGLVNSNTSSSKTSSLH